MTPNEQTAVTAILDAIEIIMQTRVYSEYSIESKARVDQKVKEARTLLEASPTVPVPAQSGDRLISESQLKDAILAIEIQAEEAETTAEYEMYKRKAEALRHAPRGKVVES